MIRRSGSLRVYHTTPQYYYDNPVEQAARRGAQRLAVYDGGRVHSSRGGYVQSHLWSNLSLLARDMLRLCGLLSS
jgi:hypothetical protein